MVSMQWFQKNSTEKFVTYVTVILVTFCFLNVHNKAKNENCVIKFISKQ